MLDKIFWLTFKAVFENVSMGISKCICSCREGSVYVKGRATCMTADAAVCTKVREK